MDDRVTSETPVRDALDRTSRECVCVAPTASLRAAAAVAAEHRDVDVLGVIDEEGKLVGLLTLTDLSDALFVHVSPEEFIVDILGPEKLGEYGRFSRAKLVSDLMSPPASVREGETVGAAFRKMHSLRLEGIPVTDPDGRPVAYLDRLLLIAVWLRTHPGLGPDTIQQRP